MQLMCNSWTKLTAIAGKKTPRISAGPFVARVLAICQCRSDSKSADCQRRCRIRLTFPSSCPLRLA